MLLLALLLLVKGSEAQFIRLTINIPAGFEVNEVQNPPRVLEPLSDLTGTGSVADIRNLRWIELRSRENVSLIISMRFNSVGGVAAGPLYFLNDGSTNFFEATRMPAFTAQVKMLQTDKLIRELPNKPAYLSAWLGMPPRQGGTLTIIYP